MAGTERAASHAGVAAAQRRSKLSLETGLLTDMAGQPLASPARGLRYGGAAFLQERAQALHPGAEQAPVG